MLFVPQYRIDLSDVHPENALGAIFCNAAWKIRLFSDVQPKKHESEIVSNVGGNCIVSSAEHSVKVNELKTVIVFPLMKRTRSNISEYANDRSANCSVLFVIIASFNPGGNKTSFFSSLLKTMSSLVLNVGLPTATSKRTSFLHPLNMSASIDDIVDEKVNDSSDVQYSNAEEEITVAAFET